MKEDLLKFNIGLVSILVLFISLIFFSDLTYANYDNWQHFLISKYFFYKPQLGLDTWGKPVFTVLCAPFAQLGFKGAQLFNFVCLFLSFIIITKILKEIKVVIHWFLLVLVIGSPVYFMCTISSLTEPLFSLLLLLSIYLYIKNKILHSILILSFLPFVRNEAYFMWIPFCFLLLKDRKIWQVTLLSSGSVLFIIISSIYYNDVLFLIRDNHYLNHNGHYGSGSVFHFLLRIPEWFGIVSASLLIYLFKDSITVIRKMESNTDKVIFLTLGCFLIYLFMHIIFWTFGIMGSLGLSRVMGGVTTVGALSIYILFVKRNLHQNKILVWRSSFLVIFNLIVGVYFIEKYQCDTIYDIIQVMKQKGLTDNYKIHYFDPEIPVRLDKNPFGSDIAQMKGIEDFNKIQMNEIIVWDTYCETEVGLNQKLFIPDKFEIIHQQKEDYFTYSGYQFEWIIFKKIKQ